MLSHDPRHFPLVRWRATEVFSKEDTDAFIGEQRAVLDRGARYLMLFDAAAMKSIGAGELRTLATEFKEQEQRLATWCAACVLVIDSPLIRGALKAFLWMQPMPMPYEVCSSFDEALGRAGVLAKQHGVSLPPSVEKLEARVAAP